MSFLPGLFRYVLLLWLLLLPAIAMAQPVEERDTPQAAQLRAQLQQLTPYQMDEVLWLARCLYSESDRPEEQRLVAWVVRNRVETQFRGRNFREVVLEHKQFSAFNEPSLRRDRILSLNQKSLSLPWLRTLQIAFDVYRAPAEQRPFSQSTRHFYSPVSMRGRLVPTWAEGTTPLDSRALGVDPRRFLFFDSIDNTMDPPPARVASYTPPALPATGYDPAAGYDPTAVSEPSGPSAETNTAKRQPMTKKRSGRSIGRFSGRVARPSRPRVTHPRRQ